MKPLEKIRAEWGDNGFDVVPETLMEDHLPSSLRYALGEIGLPVRPIDSLKLNLRFENILIEHRPQDVRLLNSHDFEAGSPLPRYGDLEFDAKAVLDGFILIGECPSDFSGTGHLSRLVCIDCGSEKIYWVHPKLSRGRINACSINSNIDSYLGSLLAYKNFRDQWPALLEKYPEDKDYDRTVYERHAKLIHERFLQDLEEADPNGFKGGFWEAHAWNEAILLEV